MKNLIIIILLFCSNLLFAQHKCVKENIILIKNAFVETYGNKVYEKLAENKRNRVHVRLKLDTLGNLLGLDEINFLFEGAEKLKKKKFIKYLKKCDKKFCVYNPESEFSKEKYFEINNYVIKYDILLVPARMSALPDL